MTTHTPLRLFTIIVRLYSGLTIVICVPCRSASPVALDSLHAAPHEHANDQAGRVHNHKENWQTSAVRKSSQVKSSQVCGTEHT